MAVVKPFNGIVYDVSRAGPIEDLITPPYDVIGPEERRAFHERNPHNIIHLDFGLQHPGDDERDNRYVRAATSLSQWLSDGVMTRLAEPSLFVLEQEYELEDGSKKTRTGFVGLVRLEELGAGRILPHERTLSKPRADRLELLRATHANLSQVFALFGDPSGTVDAALATAMGSNPLFEVVDYQSVVNRLWRLSDPSAIQIVVDALSDKVLFIADGHHRYETSLAFRDEMRKASGADGESAYDYVMMMLVNMDVQEMTILPTHRVLRGLPSSYLEGFLAKAASFFDIEESDRALAPQQVRRMQQLPAERHALGFLAEGGPFRTLTLKDTGAMDALVASDYSEAWRTLDVAVLHALVFDHVLGIDSEIALLRSDIIFEKSVARCMRLVDDGDYQAAFFLRATKIEQMREIAAREERMPQKSTFFFPKLPTGLVVHCLDQHHPQAGSAGQARSCPE